jgi:hypothetical protein
LEQYARLARSVNGSSVPFKKNKKKKKKICSEGAWGHVWLTNLFDYRELKRQPSPFFKKKKDNKCFKTI